MALLENSSNSLAPAGPGSSAAPVGAVAANATASSSAAPAAAADGGCGGGAGSAVAEAEAGEAAGGEAEAGGEGGGGDEEEEKEAVAGGEAAVVGAAGGWVAAIAGEPLAAAVVREARLPAAIVGGGGGRRGGGVTVGSSSAVAAGLGSSSLVVAIPSTTVSSSRSRSVTETINGSHHFTINGYSLAKGMGVGKYIASDTFSVGGYQWAIYFYPDGKNLEDQSLYVSVFIALASEGTDVRALFELTLLDQSGTGKNKVHSHFDRSLESGPYTLKYRGSMWGYKRFFRRAVLETSDFLMNDSLSITCTVGVVVSSTQCPKPYSIPVPQSNLGQQFGALLESGEYSDVTFEVDGEVFQAHKLVLAARSPVFKAQLFGPLRDRSSGSLHVEDIEAPVFKAMLHFIYTDTLPDINELSGSPIVSCRVDTMMAQHLLAAADRYGLDRLRLLCEAKLCKDVSVDSVATTLALAEQHHAVQLKAVCLKFAASNLAAVISSDGFEYLRESCPSLQSEILRAVAGVDEDRNKSVWAQLSDGADMNGRRVRQRM